MLCGTQEQFYLDLVFNNFNKETLILNKSANFNKTYFPYNICTCFYGYIWKLKLVGLSYQWVFCIHLS